jgi:hypothetical protein
MACLAERVAFADIGTLLQTSSEQDAVTLAFGALVGSAGLLPSQRGLATRGLFAEDAQRAWETAMARGWPVIPLRPPFETRRVRAGNHPVRRLAALALLAERFQRSDPVTELARMALEASRPARDLVQYFEIDGPTREWRSMLDLSGRFPGNPAGLVGRERASEVVVNAVLPLLFALGRVWDHRLLAETSLEIYRSFPRWAPNRLAQGMAEQIAGPDGVRLADTACRQQGLLHIFRTACEMHECATCPAFAGHHAERARS